MNWEIVERLVQIACIIAIIEIMLLLLAATAICIRNILTEKWK
jgi:hypothetical protein